MGVLCELTSSCMVDEDLPHGRGGHREKVGPILPLRAARVDQFEIRLMYEGRRLKRVFGGLFAKILVRTLPQLGVHEWEQVLGRIVIPITDPAEQDGGIGVHGFAGRGTRHDDRIGTGRTTQSRRSLRPWP